MVSFAQIAIGVIVLTALFNVFQEYVYLFLGDLRDSFLNYSRKQVTPQNFTALTYFLLPTIVTIGYLYFTGAIVVRTPFAYRPPVYVLPAPVLALDNPLPEDDIIPDAILDTMFNDLTAVGALMVGYTRPQFNLFLIHMALYFANGGASPSRVVSGNFQPAGAPAAINRLDFCRVLPPYGTRRQLLGTFATECFNYFVTHNTPPAKWASLNFTEETKFVGFEKSLLIGTRGRLPVRQVTNVERAASSANAAYHISTSGDAESISTANVYTHNHITRQVQRIRN